MSTEACPSIDKKKQILKDVFNDMELMLQRHLEQLKKVAATDKELTLRRLPLIQKEDGSWDIPNEELLEILTILHPQHKFNSGVLRALPEHSQTLLIVTLLPSSYAEPIARAQQFLGVRCLQRQDILAAFRCFGLNEEVGTLSASSVSASLSC